ncbi:CHAT domain-containing protein [Zobellia amurskyensis]|uniref:CHAT domain-containing protein n=1 Tax=Zobellia amurskyensis TaxID=248905 RepID=A0A7X3D3H3_9FLAO|nr:CHAT domain-containing protein [Zobellia amurskyensis]MUH38191.1 CHAT domain-containing protein [Zobellia amurskyensis]
MRFFLIFCLLPIIYSSYGQDVELMRIVNSTNPIEFREAQIDSLIKKKDAENMGEELAEFYHDLASKWYQNNWWEQGDGTDIQKAIYYTKKAYNYKSSMPSLNKGSLEKTMFNMAFFNYLSGKVYKAEDYYQLLIETGSDKRLAQKARRYLGMLYLKMGDFYKALESFNNIIMKDETVPGNETILIEVHLNIADTYSQMGIKENSTKIKNHLVAADSLLTQSGITDFYFTDDINHTEGDRLLEIGQFDKAIIYHQKVLKDSSNLYDYDVSLVLNSLAKSHINLNQFSLAENYLSKAIKYNPDNSNTYENIGNLHQVQNDFKKALFNYQKAITWTTNKNNEIDISNQPKFEELELSANKLFLLNHLVAKANCWLAYYKHDAKTEYLNQSLKTFSLADKLMDMIRFESTENKSKLFWREKGASLYTKAVEVCFLLKKPNEAFYFIERNKALLLLEDISNEQAKAIVHLPDSIAQREFNLKQAIFLSENELQINPDRTNTALEKLKNKVYTAKNTYNDFTDSLSTVFPEYAKLKKKVSILPYANFKKIYISEDEVVLQYILNDKQGYGLLSTENNVQFFKLQNVQDLNQEIVELYGSLTDLTMNRTKVSQYNQLSHNIFKQLVPEQVYKEIRGKKLTIISDYILQQIPFEAFVVENDPARYLIEDTEIRYAYSMSYLDAKSNISDTAQKELYAVAPIQFPSLNLPNLAFSGTEVKEVQKIFPGTIALNGDATKSAFINNFTDYKIVHLSTHADVGKNEDPWIAFSDNKMFLNEIYATKNRAEMVVLSACNTSIGELKNGEGAMSLARGFFHSGAKSVISSLWSTYDKSSKELMTAFYTALRKGNTKSEAMRKAKLDYIQKYRESAIAPAYWSALIVIGDNTPLDNQKGFLPIWSWVAVCVILFAILYFLFRRKKQIF